MQKQRSLGFHEDTRLVFWLLFIQMVEVALLSETATSSLLVEVIYMILWSRDSKRLFLYAFRPQDEM